MYLHSYLFNMYRLLFTVILSRLTSGNQVPVCQPLLKSYLVPSVLWRCCLGGRKDIRPVKNWLVECWHGYMSGARCRLAYGPADATATHTLSCFSKIQIGFTFLVPAHLGSPGQKAVKRVCVWFDLTRCISVGRRARACWRWCRANWSYMLCSSTHHHSSTTLQFQQQIHRSPVTALLPASTSTGCVLCVRRRSDQSDQNHIH